MKNQEYLRILTRMTKPRIWRDGDEIWYFDIPVRRSYSFSSICGTRGSRKEAIEAVREITNTAGFRAPTIDEYDQFAATGALLKP